jgi:16S rRNA (cytosine1402-N4)-methyltransferase
MNYSHVSIMPQECADLLRIPNVDRHIDATLGLAGHALFFLTKNPQLQIIGIDQDPYARKKATEILSPSNNKFRIVDMNFSQIGEFEDFSPQSILFDIGVSSLQFDMPERGFSFRFDAPLDMRMNPLQTLTAETIVNEYSEEDLLHILKNYGEEPEARKIAHAIILNRSHGRISSTHQLANCVAQAKTPFSHRHKNAGGHVATLTFQALRIAVNSELEVLEKALHEAIRILEIGGRIAVITFHSLEDRIVKHVFSSYFQKEKRQKYGQNISLSLDHPVLVSITKKPLEPTQEEKTSNPRSRSAKLRVVEKIA